MAKFEKGKTYQTRFAGDQNAVLTATVVKRTAKRLTIQVDGVTYNVGIHASEEGEFIFPLGRYSMAPVIRA